MILNGTTKALIIWSNLGQYKELVENVLPEWLIEEFEIQKRMPQRWSDEAAAMVIKEAMMQLNTPSEAVVNQSNPTEVMAVNADDLNQTELDSDRHDDETLVDSDQLLAQQIALKLQHQKLQVISFFLSYLEPDSLKAAILKCLEPKIVKQIEFVSVELTPISKKVHERLFSTLCNQEPSEITDVIQNPSVPPKVEAVANTTPPQVAVSASPSQSALKHSFGQLFSDSTNTSPDPSA